MSDEIDYGGLVQGTRYVVSFTDCCVEGWFVGTFEGYGPDKVALFDEDAQDCEARFDNGRIGQHWAGISFRLAEKGAA